MRKFCMMMSFEVSKRGILQKRNSKIIITFKNNDNYTVQNILINELRIYSLFLIHKQTNLLVDIILHGNKCDKMVFETRLYLLE